jgi:hypothetical protein
MTKFDVVKCQSPFTDQKHDLWYVMEKTGPRRYLQADGTLGRNTSWFPIRESGRGAIKRFRELKAKPEVRTAKVNIVIGRDNLPAYVKFFINSTNGYSCSGTEPCCGWGNGQTINVGLDDALIRIGRVLEKFGVQSYTVERIPF